MNRRTLSTLLLCAALATAAWASSPWLFIEPIPDQEGEKAQLWTYQVEIIVRNGCSPNVDYWLSGDVPPGMTISSSGLISFTPDDLDAHTITVNVLGYCSGFGPGSDSETFKLTIA